MNLLLNEISLVFNPQKGETSKARKLKRLLLLLFSFLSIITINISIGHFNQTCLDITQYVKIYDSTESSVLYFFFLLILFPIIEEVEFRMLLVFRPLFLKIGLILLFITLLFNSSINNLEFESLKIVSLKVFSTIVFALIINYGLNNSLIINYFKDLWLRRFNFVYYTQIIVFTLFHLERFNLTKGFFVLSPLFLLPYFISGLAFSYIRLRINTLASIVMHISYNLTMIIYTVILLNRIN